ncbi:type II toxin-antitoxin system RelE/ParE family toxin [Blastopirellula retiformator]|uniref:Plasmid stabilization system protein n=1 Tax=Blastopirellula retiformator TaxID=2527970 RepID=A0A5C5VLJ9_9BACT|nr:hypothetical protein Enr8_04190 [Blastopirellula retiformator]
MSGRVFWDSQADHDVNSIIDYIAIEQQSPQNAIAPFDEIYEKAYLYASAPLLGELREDIWPGVRVFSVHSCVVIYSDRCRGRNRDTTCYAWRSRFQTALLSR